MHLLTKLLFCGLHVEMNPSKKECKLEISPLALENDAGIYPNIFQGLSLMDKIRQTPVEMGKNIISCIDRSWNPSQMMNADSVRINIHQRSMFIFREWYYPWWKKYWKKTPDWCAEFPMFWVGFWFIIFIWYSSDLVSSTWPQSRVH